MWFDVVMKFSGKVKKILKIKHLSEK